MIRTSSPRPYSPRPPSRTNAVYARLLLRVRGLPSGERLPTVRDLMREFAVSQVTIDRAMAKLRAAVVSAHADECKASAPASAMR